MKLKKISCLLLCLCMATSLLPLASFAADVTTATPQYINATGWENEEPTGLEFGDFDSTNTMAVLINDTTDDENVDTYTTSANEANRLLLINNAAVTVGENGVPGEFRIAGGTGSLTMGGMTATVGNYTTMFSDDATADITDINDVAGYFTSSAMESAVYDYDVTDDFTLDWTLDAYNMTITAGKTLTIAAPTPTEEEPDPQPNPQPNRLVIEHSFTVQASGTFTAAEGQQLEICDNAAVSGVTLYDTDGTTGYTLEPEHNSETFVCTNTGTEQAPVLSWVRQNPNSGPTVPENGMFTIDWDDGTPPSGAAAVVKYSIDGGEEVTPATRDDAADVAIDAGKDLTISYTPPKDSEETAMDFWGIRVTKRGSPNDIVTDVLKASMINTSGVYSYTVTREDSETAGLLVEVFLTDPSSGGGGGDDQPQTSVFRVRYDSNALTATYKINEAAAVAAQDSQDVDYPENGSVVLTFGTIAAQQGEPSNVFYGIVVWDGMNYDYIKASELTDNSYTISTFTTSLEIEAISRPAPFDGEYMVEYDVGSVSVGDTVKDNQSITSFTTDNPLIFSFTPPDGLTEPYKVIVVPNGEEPMDMTSSVSEGTLTSTPADTTGFTLRVYWTEAEYNYAALCDGDGEFMIEYRWNGDGTVTHTGGVRFASYGKSTRVVLANDTESIDLSLTPDGGQTVDGVWQDGAQKEAGTDYQTAGGTYTMALNNNWSSVDVSFTTPAVTHTITPSLVGGNGSISPNTVQTVDEGENCQFAFQPATGYEVDEVLVDGQSVAITQPQYEFTNVTENHTISVSFKQIAGQSGDPLALIEGRHWAYGGADNAVIKAGFAAELWDMASHEFSGVFANAEAVAAAVTLSADTSSENSEFNISDSTPCPYYTYTVELGETDATGRVYVLANATDYVVMTTKDSIHTFNIVSGSECSVIADYGEGGIAVFGNGAGIEGRLSSDDKYTAFHVAARAGLTADAFRLAVYKPEFVGVKAVTAGESKYAAAWGFAQFPVASFNGSTPEEPDEYPVFFGSTSMTLSQPDATGLTVTAITGVTTTLPDGAVTITDNQNGSFTVTFNSNFYNEVPLIITYTDGSSTQTGYLAIQRVGIDIQAYQKTGSDATYNTNHGTDPGLQAQAWSDDNYAVYATYYYPTAYQEQVALYATYTWADGTVTRESINQATRTASTGGTVAIDDFLLYKGVESAAPVKVEVTAVKTGTTSTAFAGATLGSGAGVVWVRDLSI